MENIFKQYPGKIAAVIVEPVAANMGVVPPAPGFLEGLRAITKKENSLLIFDEVITGFRMAYGGAQSVYKIDPDLTVMGKIIGGGLPGCGLRRQTRNHGASSRRWVPIYQAGTLSGNPLAMRAGLATLPKLEVPGFYEDVNRKTAAPGRRLALRLEGSKGHRRSKLGRFVAHHVFYRSARTQLRRRKKDQTQRASLRFFTRC